MAEAKIEIRLDNDLDNSCIIADIKVDGVYRPDLAFSMNSDEQSFHIGLSDGTLILAKLIDGQGKLFLCDWGGKVIEWSRCKPKKEDDFGFDTDKATLYTDKLKWIVIGLGEAPPKERLEDE